MHLCCCCAKVFNCVNCQRLVVSVTDGHVGLLFLSQCLHWAANPKICKTGEIWLTYCRGNADARIGRFTRFLQAPCRTMLSHLCCLMNVEVTLLTVILHHHTSIHVFLGLPCLLVPCTYLWSASFGYLVWSILCTWPKYRIRHCCIRFATWNICVGYYGCVLFILLHAPILCTVFNVFM